MSAKKINYASVQGKIRIQTGLRIGGGEGLIQIGGIDNQIIKHPFTLRPYIPGSSLKGRLRSLLELWYGLSEKHGGEVTKYETIKKLKEQESELYEKGLILLKMFGSSAADNSEELKKQIIGAARLSFWDCKIDDEWIKEREEKFQSYTEEKFENVINRLTSKAEHPRKVERVPEGASFEINLTLKQYVETDTDDLEAFKKALAIGFALIELEGLGGNVSRGYGRVKFELKENSLVSDSDIKEKKNQILGINHLNETNPENS